MEVLNIILNPMAFITEFYPFVDYLDFDQVKGQIIIESMYQEEIKINMKK